MKIPYALQSRWIKAKNWDGFPQGPVVYLARSVEDSSLWKLGKTDRLEARLKEIYYGPYALVSFLICCDRDDATEAETFLHRKFRRKWIRTEIGSDYYYAPLIRGL